MLSPFVTCDPDVTANKHHGPGPLLIKVTVPHLVQKFPQM
jgi:hypothetical protein